MKLQLQVAEDGKITKAVFKTFGCGSVSRHEREVMAGSARWPRDGRRSLTPPLLPPPTDCPCAQAIASSSLATSWAEGKHIDDVVLIKNTDIARHLSLPPVKLHCSMLAEDAIKAAVSDYKQKQAKANNKRAADVTATPAATATVQAAA
jgi:hypothetical protein